MAQGRDRDQGIPGGPVRAPAGRRFRLRWLWGMALLAGGAAGWYFTPGSSPGPRPPPASVESGHPGLSSGNAVVPVRLGPSWQELDDPARDGWDTEVFSALAGRQLEILGNLVLHPEEISRERLELLATEDFSCGPLRPEVLRTVFQDQELKVERGEVDREPLNLEPQAAHQGIPGLGQALKALSGQFQEALEARCNFKIVGVQPEAQSVVTRQYLEVLSRARQSLREQNAVWAIRWRRSGGGSPPRIQQIGVEEFEEVNRPSGQPLFQDCTESVLGRNPSYREQFLRGLNHWLERIQDQRFFSVLGTPGLALGDVNGDGLDDLYVCQEGGLPNRLFLQNPDGTATDVSEASLANWLESTRSALLVDLDNDGHQDLAAAILGSLVLASGDGQGRFTIRTLLPTSHDTMSLSAADHDRDGDLDLYVCAYKRDDLLEESGVLSIETSADFLFHDANDGGRNILFRNDISPQGFEFTDVTEAVGLDRNNRRYSFAASWEDFDGDGDLDLYVANDFGRNNLYTNDSTPGGAVRFVDIAAAAGAEDPAASMSVSWGDFNRDGWMDLYVGNMFSAAGGRITAQAGFKPQAAPEVRAVLKRFARGNTLLSNRGDGTFRDVSVEAGVTMGRWAWGSNFIDLNNDGLEDLVVANGYLTTEDPGDL